MFFRALLGVFELNIMGDCYELQYIAKFLVSLYQCVLDTLDQIF